jgi:anti-sigma-K factor RskA
VDAGDKVMIGHDHIKELLPGYALGCLDYREAELVSDHLIACQICHARWIYYRQAVDLLALGAPKEPPPKNLKNRLLQNIGAAPAEARDQLPPPPSRAKGTFLRPVFSPAWAAVALIVIVGLATLNLMQWQVRSRSDQTGVAGELQFIKMKGTIRAPEGDGTFVISQDCLQGVLVASDLPALDEDHQYQLWLVKDGQKISGGLFSVEPNGYATVRIDAKELLTNFRAFEITVEPTGGSLEPGGYLVMASRR